MDQSPLTIQPSLNQQSTSGKRLQKFASIFIDGDLKGLSKRYILLAFAFSISLGCLLAISSYRSPLTYDETFEANTVVKPWTEMLQSFWQDPSAPLHYVLLRGWIGLFGDSGAALRSLSTVCFGLMILAIGLTSWNTVDGEGAIIATLLAAISVLGIIHASTGRMYALLGTIVGFALLVFMQFIALTAEDDAGKVALRMRYIVLLMILNSLGLLTHYIYIFFMFAYTCAAFLFASRRTFLIIVAVCASSCAVFMLLWGGMFLGTLSVPATAWMRRPDLGSLRSVLGFLWHLPGFWVTCFAGLLVIIALLRWRSILTRLVQRRFLILVAIVVLSILVPFLLSQYRVVFYPERLPIIALPVACVCLAFVFRSIRIRVVTAGLLFLLVYFSVQTGIVNFTVPSQNPSTEEIFQHVQSIAQCGDTIIIPGQLHTMAQYYLRHTELPDCIHTESYPLSTESHPGWIDPKGLLAQPELLSEEAQATASSLARVSGHKVFLFWDSAPDNTDVNVNGFNLLVFGPIKDALDHRFVAVETLHFKDLYFPELIIYSKQATIDWSKLALQGLSVG